MSGTYRYTGSTWYRNGGVVTSGDTVDGVTDAEKESFGDVLEPVDGDDGTSDESDDEDTDETTDTESYECGAETGSGDTCSRSVDASDEYCWAHTED